MPKCGFLHIRPSLEFIELLGFVGCCFRHLKKYFSKYIFFPSLFFSFWDPGSWVLDIVCSLLGPVNFSFNLPSTPQPPFSEWLIYMDLSSSSLFPYFYLKFTFMPIHWNLCWWTFLVLESICYFSNFNFSTLFHFSKFIEIIFSLKFLNIFVIAD